MVKSTDCCSSREPEFDSQHPHQTAYNCLQPRVQGNLRPLISVGPSIHVPVCPPPMHTIKIIKTDLFFFKKNKVLRIGRWSMKTTEVERRFWIGSLSSTESKAGEEDRANTEGSKGHPELRRANWRSCRAKARVRNVGPAAGCDTIHL